MAGTLYSYNVDLQQLNTSHSLAVLSVRPGSRVLDLGAADGSVARALKARGCAVWAVDQDQQAAQAARATCDHVVIADLETEEVWGALEGETFDAILALDVLEHLRQPAPILKRATHHLKPNGIVVVSLPNVTHGSLRLNLLRGRFEYTPLGLLDRTHLRFFDRNSAETLMADAGLVISERLRVTRGLEETEIPVVKDEIPPGFDEFLARDPDATTYQFVFVAHRADDGARAADGAMLSERLLAENERLSERLGELERYARSLEAERSEIAVKEALIADLRSELLTTKARAEELVAHQRELEADRAAAERTLLERDELHEEVSRRVSEAYDMQRDLRHCKSEIAVKEAFIAELRAELLPARATAEQLADREACIASLRTELLTARATAEELRRYADSAGFRLVEKIIVPLKRVPLVFQPIRTLVRMAARRPESRRWRQ